MRTRTDIEAFERKCLAPYAMKSADSLGREHEESQHDLRTCYQRDRDRIVHSEAFRKLEYKTQVFVILEGDYYRTRLTHTIEVAQIARTIGRALGLNEDLIEAIALAHDLGHPPFGHAGEYILDELIKPITKAGFNHNLRSFEIVTKFEKRYPHFSGLNLSQEVLIGILKHSTEYDEAGSIQAYRNIGTTLEAKVVDVADSLAYLSHDIDDGLTSGWITEKDLLDSHLWQKAYESIDAESLKDSPQVMKYQIVKALIDLQMKDLLAHSASNLSDLKFESSEEVKKFTLSYPKKVVIGFSQDMKGKRDYLQSLLNQKLYHHYHVERMTGKARRIIKDLFEVYDQNPNQLPYEYYQRTESYTKKRKYEVICHYIASMTDRFALDEHKKLFDPYEKV